jgi:hypothetical protein
MKQIQLRDRFFAGNLNLGLLTGVISALGAIALRRDFVICRYSYTYMIKLVDDMRFFRNFTGILGRNAERYAGVVLLKLSRHLINQSPSRVYHFNNGVSMSEDFFAGPSSKVEAKDQKTSIRNKYKRRLRNLAITLDDFIMHAELRLNAQAAGRIHEQDEARNLLESCRTLRAAIPVKNPADEELDEIAYRNLCDIFGINPDLQDDDSKDGQGNSTLPYA